MRNPGTNWKAPVSKVNMKPDSPKLVGRFETPSCQNPYPWKNAIQSERDLLAPNFSQRREGLCTSIPIFLWELPRGLGVLELWWDRHSLATWGRTEMAVWIGGQHRSLPCPAQSRWNIPAQPAPEEGRSWSIYQMPQLLQNCQKIWTLFCQSWSPGGSGAV